MKSVVIFGAGIAGLSAAHELSELGYLVSVYETAKEPGWIRVLSKIDDILYLVKAPQVLDTIVLLVVLLLVLCCVI